jgi:purine-binding chemotaxis protein CheW
MQQSDNAKKSVQTALADSDQAVFNLLEALLEEVQPDLQTDNQIKQDEVVASSPAVETQEQVKIQEQQSLLTESVEEPETFTAVDTEEIVETASLPDWTESPFQCLLVDVEGIEIAIPLMVLTGISVWDQETLVIPTQPDWHLGVVQHRDDNVVIVDTARLIMPEKMHERVDERRTNHAGHFLIINDRWGLSCNAIKETIELYPEQVKWRPLRPTRPWAIGTLIDRLCVLLDTEALMQEIEPD